MELTTLKTSDVKTAKYNPAIRTGARQLKTLAASIRKDGLLNPILVTTDRRLIDGHRRLAEDYISTGIVKIVRRVANFVGAKTDDAFKEKIYYWLVNINQTHRADMAIRDGIRPSKLRRAIESGKALKHDWR